MIGTFFSVIFQAFCLAAFALGVWGLAWVFGLTG